MRSKNVPIVPPASGVAYKQVLVLRSVLDTIRAEVRLSPKTETGGALVGYLERDGVLIVTHACGPGPRSELRRTSVLIDGKHAGAFCTQMYKQSGGCLDYVGDWHRHPGWSLEASDHDLSAMLTIEEADCCSVPYPVSAIYRSFPEKLVVYALFHNRLRKIVTGWASE